MARAPVKRLARALSALGLAGAVLHTPVEATDAERIRLAVDALVAARQPSGLLAYDFDFLRDAPSGADHVVHQADVLAILAAYYRDTKDERVRPAVEAGLVALGAHSLPIGKGALQSVLESVGVFAPPVFHWKTQFALERLGLLYRPRGEGAVIALDRDYASALAGAAAMALVAELSYARVTGDERFRDLRAAWLRGLLALRVPRRGVRTSPALLEESPTYNGEAWVALAYYGLVRPGDELVAPLLGRLDGYLMWRYAREPGGDFYPWGTTAAALRLQATADTKFLGFIRDQARGFLETPVREAEAEGNSCAAIEGLATAARVLRAAGGNQALVDRLEQRIGVEMEKNRRLQIAPDLERLHLANEVTLASPHFRRFAGAFLEGRYRPYTRIDRTAHCLSAMRELERSGPSGRP